MILIPIVPFHAQVEDTGKSFFHKSLWKLFAQVTFKKAPRRSISHIGGTRNSFMPKQETQTILPHKGFVHNQSDNVIVRPSRNEGGENCIVVSENHNIFVHKMAFKKVKGQKCSQGFKLRNHCLML